MTTILLLILTAIIAFIAGSIVERGSPTRQVVKAAEELRQAKSDLEKKEIKKEDCCDKEGCGC